MLQHLPMHPSHFNTSPCTTTPAGYYSLYSASPTDHEEERLQRRGHQQRPVEARR